MKILVTGAAGFIGFHLTRSLLENGHEVVGLDNINNYYQISLKLDRLKELGVDAEDVWYNKFGTSSKYENFRFIKLDLLDGEHLSELLRHEKFNYVVNLAAQVGVRYSVENPQAYLKSNVDGFFNLLDKCARNDIEHLVYASSSSVYGMNDKSPFSVKDTADHPISFYAATKKSNELFAHTYSHLYNLPTTGLRFFTVYGPWGRPDMATFIFTKKIFEGKPITVFNNGNLKRDFTYISDIIDGIEKILSSPPTRSEGKIESSNDSRAPYKVYNLGNNQPEHIRDFIATLERHIGKAAVINYKPLQPGDLVETFADIDETQLDFDFKPKFNLNNGLKEFVDWFRSYYQFD